MTTHIVTAGTFDTKDIGKIAFHVGLINSIHMNLLASSNVPMWVKEALADVDPHLTGLLAVMAKITNSIREQLDPPEGLDVEAAARIHNLNPADIRSAILGGKLPAKSNRVRHHDLIMWIAEGCR